MSGRPIAALVLGGLACAGGARACLGAEAWPGPPAAGAPAVGAGPAPAPSSDPVSRDRQLATGSGGADFSALPGVDRQLATEDRGAVILLTPARLRALRARRDAGTPGWQILAAACEDDARRPIASGYEAWDWANAALDLALCAEVSRRPDYARAALGYFRALLDDRYKVGDGAGGDEVVRHDHGYGIRSRGALGGLALDWLRDAPGMTPALRAHAVDRFVAWTRWFGEAGYNRDHPIANYYAGWFGALAFAGFAAGSDDPRAADMLRRARRMYRTEIAPTFRRKLAGGDFPEGWQYGDMVGAFLALFADAEARAGGGSAPFDVLPWLGETVTFRTHALWPDGRHMLDGGDWSRKPAVAPAHTLLALATVLPASDPASGPARALAQLARDPHGEEWSWLAALGESEPSRAGARPVDDPRVGATSYLASGTGTLTARTDWSARGTWFALTSAPSLSDHQHLDAGHFELVRGADALLVDGGGYGAYSSLSHNVIAIDDGKENDTYSPNQAVWSDAAAITRHDDDGRFVHALAEYASAYNPAGYPVDHPARSVARAEREIVFSRSPVPGLGPQSARLVVYDRITLTNPAYGATFLLHGPGAPAVDGATVRFAVGRSEAVAITVLPEGATPQVVPEPTTLGDGPYYANDPPEGTEGRRVEVRSPAGGLERRFLHAVIVAERGAVGPAASPVEGARVDGVAIADEAYMFVRSGEQARAEPLEYTAPATAVTHIVGSLAPGARYVAAARPDGASCRVSLVAAVGTRAGEEVIASAGGTVALAVGAGCVAQALPAGKR